MARASLSGVLGLALVAALAARANAQTDEPPEPPPRPAIRVPAVVGEDGDLAGVAPAVQRLLTAAFLSDDERAAARLRHGVWQPADLGTPAARAEAALVCGAVGDAVFNDPSVPAVVRADALLARGEASAALETLGEDVTARGARVRAFAFDAMGRSAEAVLVADEAAARATDVALDADETAELVRTLALRRRITGPGAEGGADDAALLEMLKLAREDKDPRSWLVRLVEAELLRERHNLKDATEAAAEALALNPRCAAAMALIGGAAVDAFALDDAREIASRMDAIAAPFGSISAGAELVRARAELRQDAPALAIAAAQRLLAAHPDHRQGTALLAASHHAAFDAASGDEALARLDALAPGHPLGHYEVGAALSEQRQYDDARRHLAEAARRRPRWALPHMALGLLEVQAGRDGAARDALSTALALDAFNERARNSLALLEGLSPWPTVESEHFRVRYRPGPDAVLAREMLPVLEAVHARVAADPRVTPGGFDHEPPEPTLIEIMPGHRWFSVRITGMTRVHTMAASTGPVVAMESPREGAGFTVGPFDWPRVLQHEYAHTVTLSRTRNRIPHWFTEAAAVNVEDAPRDRRTWELLLRAHQSGTLFDLDQINTAFVRPQRPSDRGQAYAQGHWMFRFIVERFGPRAPLDLMDRYAAGEDELAAFEAVIGLSRDDFMDAFRAWAEEDLRAHRLLPEPGVPTMAVLVAGAALEAGVSESEFELTDAQINAWLASFPGHAELVGAALERALAAHGPPEQRPARLDPPLLELLTLATSARPTDDRPHRLLARHHLAGPTAADRALAVPHLRFIDAREQNSVVFAAELASLLAEQRRFDEALAAALRAVRISPFDADHREQAARIAILAGDLDTAEAQIAALTELEPDRPIHARRLEAIRAKAGR